MTLKTIDIKDGFIFLGSIIIAAAISYSIFGISGVMWSSFSVLVTYTLYDARADRANHLYIFLWIVITIISTYIGSFLGLGPLFYIYLFGISYFFYLSFGKDPVMDRAVRYIIVLATIGTTLPHVSYELPASFIIGTVIALIILFGLSSKNIDFDAFRKGLFSRNVYSPGKNTLLRAFIYSTGMFLALLIPDFLHIGKPYWAPLTFVFLLNPKAEHILKMTLFRFWGSLLAVFSLSLLMMLPSNPSYTLLIYLVVVVFLYPSFLNENFAIKTFGISCLFLTLTETTFYWHDPTYSLLYNRIYETVIGGCMALLTSFILKRIRDI